jgi:hypothetical protein
VTEKQLDEYTRLRKIMVQSIDTMEMPQHMPPSVAKLFKEIVGVREGSMTRHLIDHFAEAIAVETIKD